MANKLVLCSIEMVGVHANIETGSEDEWICEEEEPEKKPLPEGHVALWIAVGSSQFVASFPLPDMRENALAVLKAGRFDSFIDKAGRVRSVKAKYDIFSQSGTDVCVGNPRDKSTWESSGYNFMSEEWSEIIHHYEGHIIYEIRLKWVDGKVKRVNLHKLKDDAKENAISGVCALLR